MRIQKHYSILCGLLASSLLISCGSVLESGKPARQVYLLKTPAVTAVTRQADERETLFLSVSAVPGMDSDLIQVLNSDARLTPVANAHWPDNLPEVFSSITRRYLTNSGQFKSVRSGSLARPGQWQLHLEIGAFYGVQNSSGTITQVVLQMAGMLECDGSSRDLSIQQESGVGSDSLSTLVAAHQSALDAALRALPGQIIGACSGMN